MSLPKKLLTTAAPGPSNFGPDVRQIVPGAISAVDPFVFFDHYGPFEKQSGWPGVPLHPHAGIATITYVLEGTNRHADTFDHDVVMHQNDLAYMVAGKGIEHAEGRHPSALPPETSHGIQFWISLPAAHKFTDPSFGLYPADELPKLVPEGTSFAEVTVLAGSLGDATSPLLPMSPAYIYEVKVPPGSHGETVIPIAHGDSSALYVIEGAARADGTTISTHEVASFSLDGDRLSFDAPDGLHAIVFGGTPLNEPIVTHGSFVMNSQQQIQQVLASYRNGEMRK